nr:hypothetical protein [uncultured Flavobacterium sp.]
MEKTKISLLTICASELIYVFCSKEAIVNQADSSFTDQLISRETKAEADHETKTSFTTAVPGICNNITVEKPTAEAYPKVFNLDFGNTNSTENEITKNGKLKITLSGPLTTTGSQMKVERIDYAVNGIKLEGTIVYTNTTAEDTFPEWTGKVENAKLIDRNGKIYTKNGFHVVQQTEGFSTTTLEDKVYEITEGEYVVTSDTGGKLTLTIHEALVKKYSCAFISKGKLKIEGSFLNGIIDYGNNECDPKYTYTHEDGTLYTLGV